MARARWTRPAVLPSRRRLDPRRAIVLHHVSDGPARGWLHTHGLAAHGKPELEVRNVPLFLGALVAGLLNDFADYLLNDATAPLLAGESIRFGSSSIHVVEGHADLDAGYEPGHYRDLRLVLVDPPDTGCACEECAKERARRTPLKWTLLSRRF
jgi:hypothetical protein